jgi:hypothetical protein
MHDNHKNNERGFMTNANMEPDDLTSIERFISTVMDMRTAQKQYFKTRDTKWLNNSKQLERDVDRLIDDWYKQGKLELL